MKFIITNKPERLIRQRTIVHCYCGRAMTVDARQPKDNYARYKCKCNHHFDLVKTAKIDSRHKLQATYDGCMEVWLDCDPKKPTHALYVTYGPSHGRSRLRVRVSEEIYDKAIMGKDITLW